MKFVEYVLRKLIPFFIVSLIFIALILNLVDLFMNISRYLEMNAPGKEVFRVMILYIPKTIWYAAPIAFLFSVTYILSDLYAKNEMEALFASGVSLFRFVLPVLITGALLSIGMFFLEDKLVVNTLEQKTALQKKLLDQEESANNDNIVVLSDSGRIIYKARRYRDSAKRLENVYFVIRDENKTLQAIIHANQALWNEEKLVWELEDAVQFVNNGESLEKTSVYDEFKSLLTESYEIFRKNTVDVASVNAADAKVYINHLKKAGLPYNEPLSVYYKKFAFPFILFIAAFLAVGVTGKTRKNVLLISLSLSIAAVVLFYVFQMATMVLAKTGVITPFMGAWLPDIVFLFIAGVLLKFSRT
ncbi:MAG: LptF/LptG family permease [Treponema sp.]|nr:LptF/LptG family permease [Treponema sp.]